MENNHENKPELPVEKKKLVLDNAAIEADLLREGRSWFYQLCLNLFTAVAKLLFFVRIEGKENIPEGACVIMGNHRAWMDPFLLAMCARDREIRFMGKRSSGAIRYLLGSPSRFAASRWIAAMQIWPASACR